MVKAGSWTAIFTCFASTSATGSSLPLAILNVKQLLGTDSRTIKDVNGEPFGQEMYDAYQKPEGQITEVSYMWARPGPDKTPVPKVSFVTRFGDLRLWRRLLH